MGSIYQTSERISSEEKCYCEYVTLNRSVSVTAWEDYDIDGEAEGTEGTRGKEVAASKGKKQWATKSRYGYESLEDKYRFSHYLDIHKYIEEYSEMFSVVNRTHKRGVKPNGTPYRFIRMPLSRTRPGARDSSTEKHNKECESEDVILYSSGIKEQRNKEEEAKAEKTPNGGENIISSRTESQTPVAASENTRAISSSTSSQSQPAVESLKAAPALSVCYDIDYTKDTVRDEYEDDEEWINLRVPLVKQLNSFFLNKYGKRKTSCLTAKESNLFPHIHSSCEHTSQDLGEMTAASIINYKVPTARIQKTPSGHHPSTSHPKIAVLKSMENQHAKFKPMIERQKTQMFPMRMKTINTSNMNHYDHLNSAMQTANHKRFSALPFRRASPTEKGLPRTHILTAKTISKRLLEQDSESAQDVGVVPSISKSQSADKSETTSISDKHNRYKQTMQKIVLSYGCKSLHPYLNTGTEDCVAGIDHKYGKAELVDYSTAVANSYQAGIDHKYGKAELVDYSTAVANSTAVAKSTAVANSYQS